MHKMKIPQVFTLIRHFGSGSPQEIAGESDFNRFIIGVYIKRLNVVSINKKTVF